MEKKDKNKQSGTLLILSETGVQWLKTHLNTIAEEPADVRLTAPDIGNTFASSHLRSSLLRPLPPPQSWG